MKKTIRFTALLLCAVTLVISTALRQEPPAAHSSDNEYYTYLLGLGFPASYAEKLTELHLLHPAWTEPLW